MKTMCATCIKTLGDDSRVEIYQLLAKEKVLRVKDLVNKLSINQPTVSYHLKKLQMVGLVDYKKKGKNSIYFVKKVCPHYKNTCILQK